MTLSHSPGFGAPRPLLTVLLFLLPFPILSPETLINTIDLGGLHYGDYSFALAINNRGQIAGFSQEGICGPRSAVVWYNGRITELPSLPGSTYTSAYAINDPGQIVGVSGGHDCT